MSANNPWAAYFITVRNEKELENIPKKIVHPDDILLICILGINSYGSTRLYPNIASILLHPTIVLRHTLALIQYWGKTKQKALCIKMGPKSYYLCKTKSLESRGFQSAVGTTLCIH